MLGLEVPKNLIPKTDLNIAWKKPCETSGLRFEKPHDIHIHFCCKICLQLKMGGFWHKHLPGHQLRFQFINLSCDFLADQRLRLRYGGHLRPYLSVTCDPTPLKSETRSLATLPLFTAPTTQNYTWSLATLPTTTRENTTRSPATLPTQIGRVTSDH